MSGPRTQDSVMRFIGDIHGLLQVYEMVLRGCSQSIQIGDFGIGLDGVRFPAELGPEHRFIRGNHDNPELCLADPHWIADGSVIGDMMLIGGAWSFDHAFRSPGKDWWPDEQLPREELEQLIETYAEVEPRLMVTHDCPERLLRDLFYKDYIVSSATGFALDEMLKRHRPQMWIFGHHHRTVDQTIEGTCFICLDEGDYVDVDLQTLETVGSGRWSWPENMPWKRTLLRAVGKSDG